MSFQWNAQRSPAILLEWHDLAAEPGAGAELATLLRRQVAPATLAAGIVDLGLFTATGQPDRLLVLRGFADRTARTAAYARFFASANWVEARASFAGLMRRHEVTLTRAIRPEAGLPGQPFGPLVVLRSDLRDPEDLGDFHLWQRLLLRKAGLDPLAAYATLEAVNDVPAVPVARHATTHLALLRDSGAAWPAMPPELLAPLRFPPEWLRLERVPALVA